MHSTRKEDANKDFLRHSSDSVKALAREVCLPLLWQLAEMSEIEDVACLEFFTEGQQACAQQHVWFDIVARCTHF